MDSFNKLLSNSQFWYTPIELALKRDEYNNKMKTKLQIFNVIKMDDESDQDKKKRETIKEHEMLLKKVDTLIKKKNQNLLRKNQNLLRKNYFLLRKVKLPLNQETLWDNPKTIVKNMGS